VNERKSEIAAPNHQHSFALSLVHSFAMSRRLIRILVALSVVSIIGILMVQAVWLRNVYTLRERQFRQSAVIALQEVAGDVARLNRFVLTRYAVTQLAPDYFVVNTDSPIDPITLESLIQTRLKRHDLITDFEYGIYDCQTDQMVYGNYVTPQPGITTPTCQLPKFGGLTYYFGIRFPARSRFVAGQLTGWLWSTGAVLLVVIFFGYTLWVVLRQRRLTEIQRDFINTITHELQTPVATIKIAAGVLQDTAIIGQPDRLAQYARILTEESGRLQRQINNVLQVARVTDKPGKTLKTSLNRADVDLHSLLKDIAAAHQPHVSLDLRATNPVISADRYHLENILNNLIDNGLKYCQNRPCIILKTRQEGKQLIWSVADNGIGIAPEHQRAVFRQFYRVPQPGQTQQANGFGLGLYYVWQVARAHGWKLTLTSTPGLGSEFSVTCPVLNHSLSHSFAR
jgi:two-component system, OmpR family, phosphate regulon sensor histidine kinase PhoR